MLGECWLRLFGQIRVLLYLELQKNACDSDKFDIFKDILPAHIYSHLLRFTLTITTHKA